MTMKRMRKVKWDGERVTVVYERLGAGDEPDQVSVVCADAPALAFRKRLDDLRPHVTELCEIADPEWRKTLTVLGVTLSYSKDGVLGATITATKDLRGAAAPLVLNTPHQPGEPSSDTMPTAHCLTPACRRAVEALIAAAWDYVEGIREQGDLFSGRATLNDALAAAGVGA